jgi:hypothetical protein
MPSAIFGYLAISYGVGDIPMPFIGIGYSGTWTLTP